MNAVAALPLLTHHTDDWGHPWWPLWLLFWAALIGTGVWLIARPPEPTGEAQHEQKPGRRPIAS